MRRAWHLALALALAVGGGFPAAAQQQWPDTSGYYVSAGGTATITAFGVCKIVTNNNSNTIAVPTHDATEWSTGTTAYINHPPPNVVLTACSSGCTIGQTQNQTSTQTQACPSPQTGNETRTETQAQVCTFIGASTGWVNTGSPTFSAWNTSGCSSAGTCTMNGVTHANGSQWPIDSSGTEPCSDITGYTNGTATQQIVTVYQCNNGSIGVVSTTPGAWDTSGCTNVDGGNCPLQTAASCGNPALHPVSATCEWQAYGWGEMVPPSPLQGQFCYLSSEYASEIQWVIGSNGCCQPQSVVVPCSQTGACNEQLPWGGLTGPGYLASQVVECVPTNRPPAGGAPTGGCPNGTTTCTVTCPSNIQ